MPLELFRSMRPWNRASMLRDAVAGVSLASMNIPQVLGYTRIAGTPVVTGLYTLLLPLVAFAIFGSSRHLVVAADSATAAIFASGLSRMAPAGHRAIHGAGRRRRAAHRGNVAGGAAFQTGLPGRFSVAHRTRRISCRRGRAGRRRGARRDAGHHRQRASHGRPDRGDRSEYLRREFLHPRIVASHSSRACSPVNDGRRACRYRCLPSSRASRRAQHWNLAGRGIAVIGPVPERTPCAGAARRGLGRNRGSCSRSRCRASSSSSRRVPRRPASSHCGIASASMPTPTSSGSPPPTPRRQSAAHSSSTAA